MPQMSPMLWSIMLIMSSTMITISNCLLFTTIKLKTKKKMLKNKNNNWIW